ncbi:hypothetical protein [Mesorhizobium sp. DCY119]|uniref:hypothetical protein n=1 Tax=Mesorhizobium sp. DCY119 TaxID=2108445 RepID=UPI0010591632|nr:hypothetical protein [Mesorhizobium sp. DCY119]
MTDVVSQIFEGADLRFPTSALLGGKLTKLLNRTQFGRELALADHVDKRDAGMVEAPAYNHVGMRLTIIRPETW